MFSKKTTKNKPWREAESLREYTNNAIKRASPSWRRCLRSFSRWLEEDRRLALSSITVRVSSVRYFLEAQEGQGGVRTLKRLTVTSIEDFFIDYTKDHGPAAQRSMQAGVRLFLRFADSKGWITRDLSSAVMSLRSYRLSTVPRGLSKRFILRLVEASSGKSARDHCLALLFAIYGARRGQVAGLRLEDIDWQRKTITFHAHKGGKTVVHMLVPAVAEGLSKYLRNERPMVNSKAVFLRAKKPYLPMGPSAITAVIGGLMRGLGLEICTPCGPHALRHALATRLLQNGQPLKVIADLLGHRSLDAASVYIKVDHPRLLEVAGEWPEVAS